MGNSAKAKSMRNGAEKPHNLKEPYRKDYSNDYEGLDKEIMEGKG